MGKSLLGFLIAFLLIAVIGFIILATGVMPIDASSSPPRWEAAIAGMALDASVARRAGHLQNPVEPTEQNLISGMKLYVDNCQECHGGAGKPSIIGSQSLYPRAPQFGRRRSSPQPTAGKPPAAPPKGQSDRESTTFWIVKNGIRYTGMPAWEKSLKDEEIWQVVTFLSHMRNLPPSVQKAWQTETESQSQ